MSSLISRFKEASALLDAGANPGCGSKERIPKKHLEEIIDLLPKQSELLAEALELKEKIATTLQVIPQKLRSGYLRPDEYFILGT